MDDTLRKRLRIEKQKTTRQTYIHYLSMIVMATALAFLAVMVKSYCDGDFDSVESFQRYIEQFGYFGPLFLIFFQAGQVVLPVLPGLLGCAVGSVMFGPVVGFLCNYIGISTGSVIAFFLARKFGMPLVKDLFPSEKYKKWSKWASESKSYTTFLFLAMLLPFFPDDFLCYFTGVTGMKTKKFIVIVILGKPWCILAYSLVFSLIK